MKAFWESMKEEDRNIPNSIVFFVGPRLSDKGFRWAPASFLGSVCFDAFSRPESREQIARVSSEGLLAQFAALEVQVGTALTSTDRAAWARVLGEMPQMCLLRHRKNVWYMLAGERPPGVDERLPVMDVLRINSGKHMILTNHLLEAQDTEMDENQVCPGLSGTLISNGTEDVIRFHAETPLGMLRIQAAQSKLYEAVWVQSQDKVLRSMLSPFEKDPQEEPLRTNSSILFHVPNKAVARMLQLADIALQDPEIRLSATMVGDMRANFAENIVLFLAEWYGEIGRMWPREQQWCID